jgi:hypothetical protein
MIDNWTVPGFRGDNLPDLEDGNEVVKFEVTRDGDEGYIYYDEALIYDRQVGIDGGDDLFEALVGLGRRMEARGYVEMVEQERGSNNE